MMYKQKRGFIIPLTLAIISLSVAIVSYIYVRSVVFVPYMNVMAKREQAKMLALGGVNIALEQLAQKEKEESAQTGKPGEKKAEKPDPAKQMLKNSLAALNRSQTFTLKEEKDGITGEIQILISCEAGKIPLNEVWNFETQKFIDLEENGQHVVIAPGGKKLDKKSWKDILQELFKRIETQMEGKNLFEAFEKFLKTRQYKVNDVTELLTIKEFEVFKHSVWYEASQGTKEKKGEKKYPLYLQDLFTITSTNKINPWYFSDSLLGLLGIPRAQTGEVKKREKQASKWIQNFKPTQAWKTEWEKQLKPVYGIDLQNLPKGIEMILDSTEVPDYFSIVSQGTFEQVSQRVVAIIFWPAGKDSAQKNAAPSIYRMYWL